MHQTTTKPVSELESNIKIAVGYLMWKKYDSAIMLLLPLINKYSSYPIIYEKLANCYFLKDDFKKALYYIKKAINLNPDDYLYYITLSRIHSFMQEYNKSIKYFEKAIELYYLGKKIFPPIKIFSKNSQTKICYLELNELFKELQLLIFIGNNIILKEPYEYKIIFNDNYYFIQNEDLQIKKSGEDKLLTFKSFCHAIIGFYNNYVLGYNDEMDNIYNKISNNIKEIKKRPNRVQEYYKKNKSKIDKLSNRSLNTSEDLELFYETLPYRQQANLTLFM